MLKISNGKKVALGNSKMIHNSKDLSDFKAENSTRKGFSAWKTRMKPSCCTPITDLAVAFVQNHQDPLTTHDFVSNTLTLFQMHSKHMTLWITCKFTTLLQQVQSKTAKKCLMCSWFLNCCFPLPTLNLKAYLQSSNNTITRCDRCNNEDFEHVSDANLG